MQEGGLAPTEYGLKNVAAGVGQAAKGAIDTFGPPKTAAEKVTGAINPLALPVKRIIQGIMSSGSQVAQVPGAIKDIAASPDPLGHLARAAGDTAGQAGGQAAAAAVTEGAVKAPGALRTALSKSGVTSEMATKIAASLDKVAEDAGLPKSTETSLSGKAADTVKGLKGQAQQIYGELDKASGGRYQRYVDEIDQIEDAMRNKYTPPDQMLQLNKQLNRVKLAYADMQKQLISQGVDPGTIAKADAKWAQAKALEQVGKKFKNAENLAGEVRPGTSSVDTGLKNLKPHILKQAAGSEAPAVKNAVIEGTNRMSKVERNQAIAKFAAGAGGLGAAGGLAYGLAKK